MENYQKNSEVTTEEKDLVTKIDLDDIIKDHQEAKYILDDLAESLLEVGDISGDWEASEYYFEKYLKDNYNLSIKDYNKLTYGDEDEQAQADAIVNKFYSYLASEEKNLILEINKKLILEAGDKIKDLLFNCGLAEAIAIGDTEELIKNNYYRFYFKDPTEILSVDEVEDLVTDNIGLPYCYRDDAFDYAIFNKVRGTELEDVVLDTLF